VSAAEPRIVYSPRTDATLENELNALACVYRFVLERHAAKAAAAGSFRLRPEGGVNGPLTKEPDEDVDSSPMEEPKFGGSHVTSREDPSS
jgi:hypothetical protein